MQQSSGHGVGDALYFRSIWPVGELTFQCRGALSRYQLNSFRHSI